MLNHVISSGWDCVRRQSSARIVRILLLFVPALLLVSGSTLGADTPNTGPPEIKVMLKAGASSGDPRIIVVGPRAAGVCYGKADCPDSFEVMWVGSHNEGEKIRIKFTTLGANLCFDKTDFTVDGVGAVNKQTVTVLDDDLCIKQFFPFTISCEGGEGGDCGGVKPVDPGAMVDG